ncbi:MAG: acyltransferase family protein [Collinsella sp.]
MQPKAARNISIEALRLVAVAGIAVFHTFQWTFQAVCTGLPEYAPLAVLPYSGALGFINLLGCWANEVFFMISGYFLIPSAVRALQKGHLCMTLRANRLLAYRRSSFRRCFIALPACLSRCISIPCQKSHCTRLAGSRWVSSLSGSTLHPYCSCQLLCWQEGKSAAKGLRLS